MKITNPYLIISPILLLWHIFWLITIKDYFNLFRLTAMLIEWSLLGFSILEYYQNNKNEKDNRSN